MSISNDTVFAIANGVKTREETFGLLVISNSTPALSLNMDSKFIWNLLDGKRKVSDLLSLMREEYQEDGIEKSLIEVLETFHKLGLIEIVNNM